MAVDLRAPGWTGHIGPVVLFKTRSLAQRSLSMSSTATFWDRSKLSASHGIAKCRSPNPRNPPNDRMASATRLFLGPDRGGILFGRCHSEIGHSDSFIAVK